MALPDFFISSAPKAGTTALHAALAAHPALFMSPIKEPKFFLTDGPPPARGGGPADVQTICSRVMVVIVSKRMPSPERATAMA